MASSTLETSSEPNSNPNLNPNPNSNPNPNPQSNPNPNLKPNPDPSPSPNPNPNPNHNPNHNPNSINVVVEGCAHGELDAIYASIRRIEEAQGITVDLLICCGDFQAVRGREDLSSMAIPQKYLTLGSFHKYFTGQAVAPVLTLFISGNHEASNYLQELHYGGWVAPNIYFLGFSGCVRFGGLRIAGLSGIYKDYDYRRGRFETPPYDRSSIRSIYHVREVDAFKLGQLTGKVDIGLSHDWPCGIYNHGDIQTLLQKKPFFRREIETGQLGSPAAAAVLDMLRPSYWFSAHLHVKFAAIVRHHEDESKAECGGKAPREKGMQVTRFLALDKCLPNRHCLQLLSIDRPQECALADSAHVLCYDAEWLAIVKKTHGLLNEGSGQVPLPQQSERPTRAEVEWVETRLPLGGVIPSQSFYPTPAGNHRQGNPQTDASLAMLEMEHRVTIPWKGLNGTATHATTKCSVPPAFLTEEQQQTDPNEIPLDDEVPDEQTSNMNATISTGQSGGEDPNEIDI